MIAYHVSSVSNRESILQYGLMFTTGDLWAQVGEPWDDISDLDIWIFELDFLPEWDVFQLSSPVPASELTLFRAGS